MLVGGPEVVAVGAALSHSGGAGSLGSASDGILALIHDVADCRHEPIHLAVSRTDLRLVSDAACGKAGARCSQDTRHRRRTLAPLRSPNTICERSWAAQDVAAHFRHSGRAC
jgi:hypothetical protein